MPAEENQTPAPDQPAAPEFKPTHRHYKGGLYCEIIRLVGNSHAANERIVVSGGIDARVTDDIAEGAEFVVYMQQGGAVYARPAAMFDGMVDLMDENDPTRVSESVRRFEPLDEQPAEAAAPPPGAEANSNESPIDAMSRAEMRDRYRLAQYALGGVPPLPLLQVSINMLIAGGGLQGQLLGKRLNVVVGNFLAQEAKRAEKKRIILPGGSPAVPHGLGGKGR